MPAYCMNLSYHFYVCSCLGILEEEKNIEKRMYSSSLGTFFFVFWNDDTPLSNAPYLFFIPYTTGVTD